MVKAKGQRPKQGFGGRSGCARKRFVSGHGSLAAGRFVERRFVERRFVERRFVERRFVERRFVERRFVERRFVERRLPGAGFDGGVAFVLPVESHQEGRVGDFTLVADSRAVRRHRLGLGGRHNNDGLGCLTFGCIVRTRGGRRAGRQFVPQGLEAFRQER